MLKVLQHPLITHKLTQMRKKETGTKDFRQNLDEIAGLMAYEISRDFPLQPVEINTPVAKTTTYELAKEIVLVPILRAGLDVYKRQGFLFASVGLIGYIHLKRTHSRKK